MMISLTNSKNLFVCYGFVDAVHLLIFARILASLLPSMTRDRERIFKFPTLCRQLEECWLVVVFLHVKSLSTQIINK